LLISAIALLIGGQGASAAIVRRNEFCTGQLTR
jgi:hypothetical protein